MKLKELKETAFWQVADCCEYYDKDGNEVELPNTEVERRKFDNKKIKKYHLKNYNRLTILVIYFT